MEKAENDEKVNSEQNTFYDKLYDLYIDNGKAITRSILLIIFFSCVVILVSTNSTSVQKFSFLGLEFTLPSAYILLGGSWIIGGLYIYILALMKYSLALQYRIERYNESLPETKLPVGSKEVPFVDRPIISPNVVFIVVNTGRGSNEAYPHKFIKYYFQIFNFLTFLIMNLIWLLFPLIALFYVGYIMVTSRLPIAEWLVWLSAIILWIVPSIYSINFLIQFFMNSSYYKKNDSIDNKSKAKGDQNSNINLSPIQEVTSSNTSRSIPKEEN